jgi:hypothetical protein
MVNNGRAILQEAQQSRQGLRIHGLS